MVEYRERVRRKYEELDAEKGTVEGEWRQYKDAFVGVAEELCGRTSVKGGTVEPLTNDHPHQRPSLSYDHISCDGQWFLFVYESLTSDHPSYTTTPM